MPETNFFWDPLSDNILQERDETGAVTAQYTTEPGLYGNLISQNRGGVESQFHYDAQGSTLAVTDDNQQITDTFAYTAFGEVTARTGTTEVPFQYIGQKGYYTDTLTGQLLIRRRPYEPARARWLSVDPIRSSHPLNYYSYARNRPVSATDPSGMICCCTETPIFISIYACIGFHWGVTRKCAPSTAASCGANEKPPTWDEACDPRTACGKVGFTPLPPPTKSPPTAGMPCHYPNRRVCHAGMCFESQCVCQCAGNSPALNCIRGCISQCDKLGGPKTIEPEELCKKACPPLTQNEVNRLSCCINSDWNMGGCNSPFFEYPPHPNPNPANTTCTSMPVP